MNAWCRKIVLAFSLAVLPLQGVAATLTVLLCHGDAQVHAAHAATGHDHGHQNDNQPNEDAAGGSVAGYHHCCNVTVSALSAMTPPSAPPESPARVVVSDRLYHLFVPELPQRPPLA